MLPRWKRGHTGTEIYVYMGIALSDPTTLVMPSQEEAMTPSILEDWRWFQDNMKGWIDCGVTGFGIDNASLPKHTKSFVEIARVLSISGIKCIGEAIPTEATLEDAKAFLRPSRDTLSAPFFALDQYIHQRDPKGRWRFDPRTTECGVGASKWMRFGSRAAPILVTEEMIRDWVRRGLILYVYDKRWDELAMQLERDRKAHEPDPGMTDADTGDAG